MSDPQKLIKEFKEAASKEGIDLDADLYMRVLLWEVIEGGWSDRDEEWRLSSFLIASFIILFWLFPEELSVNLKHIPNVHKTVNSLERVISQM